MTTQLPAAGLDETSEVVLATAGRPLAGGAPLPSRRVYLEVAVFATVVLLIVGVVGAVLGPARSEVDATRRVAVLDEAVRQLVLNDAVLRVKLWTGRRPDHLQRRAASGGTAVRA